MSKTKYAHIIAIAMIALVAGFGLVRAYSGDTPKVVVEGDYIEAASQAVVDAAQQFGGQVSYGLQKFVDGIAITGNKKGIKFSDNGESHYVDRKWLHGECTAATSSLFSISHPDGYEATSTVYVTDFLWQNTGASTSTTQGFMGTSTTQYVNEDTYKAVADPSITTVGGFMYNVPIKNAAYQTSSSTVFLLKDFLNPADRGIRVVTSSSTIPFTNWDGQGNKVYLNGYASSTWTAEDAGGYTMSLYDCEYHMEYTALQ